MSEAVTVEKQRRTTEAGAVRTLSTGVRIRLRPVALGLWQDALLLLRGKEPKVPTFKNPEKGGREEENPSDPDYQKALAAFQEEQNRVSADVLLMFGVALEDGMPEDDEWLKRLRALQKFGTIDLSRYDLDDPFEKEFVYKKYVAVAPSDASLIGRGWGPTEEEVGKTEEFFQGTEARSTD